MNTHARKILDFKWAEPFRPFVVETTDGRRFRVQDFANVTVLPLLKRNTVHVATSDGFHAVPISAVKSVALGQAPQRASRKRQQ